MILYVKFIVVPVVLWWLLQSFLEAGITQTLRGAIHLMVLAIVLNQIAIVLFSWRLKFLGGIYGVTLKPLQALKIHLQSIFYQVFSPMSIGMELARFLKIRALRPDVTKTRLLTALLSDRVWSLVATVLTGLSFAPFVSFVGFSEFRINRYVMGGALALVVLMALVALRSARLRNLLHRLITAAVEQKGSAFRLGTLALVTHLTAVTAVYYLLHALRIEVGLVDCQFGVSLSMLFLVIPLSFLGITLTEAASFAIFAALGYTREEAALVATCLYALRILGAFQGGIWEFVEDGYRIRAVQKEL